MSKSLQTATIGNRLWVIKHFHRIAKEIELVTAHPVVVYALKGVVARCHAEFGKQSCLRRPLSWPMLRDRKRFHGGDREDEFFDSR